MYNPVNTTNAIHTTFDGMKASSNNAAVAAHQVEDTNKQSDKSEALKKKRKRARVQTVSLRSGPRRGKNVIDVVA